MFRKAILACAAVAALASTPASASVDFWGNLLTYTHSDFVAADADAKAHSDTLASTCWEGADSYLYGQQGAIGGFVRPGTPVGAASTFQAARDVVKAGLTIAGQFKATGKVPQQLEVACGPLFVDSIDDLRATANVFGITVGSHFLGF